jgi:hypothetical protein
MLMGLVASAVLAHGDRVQGLGHGRPRPGCSASCGTDVNSGMSRYTFEVPSCPTASASR